MKHIKYPKWTLIEWDGNKLLGYKCWRKSFGRGHVSVGQGKFLSIVYSHGNDSDDSISSTRWNYDSAPLTEKEAMAIVDRNKGFYNPEDTNVAPSKECITKKKNVRLP